MMSYYFEPQFPLAGHAGSCDKVVLTIVGNRHPDQIPCTCHRQTYVPPAEPARIVETVRTDKDNQC